MFRLQINSIGRTGGHSATGAAAYRAGERLRDERTGELHNHSRRKDVTHKEIMLPSDLAGAKGDWARERSGLWNAVEQAESKKNARVAREFQVNLPSELSAPQRVQLARAFSQEIADHYKIAVDLSVHDPRAGGDPRNFHAHLLATTREVTAAGLGSKAGLDMSADKRRALGLPNESQEYTAIRERWATLTNEALREANIDARVDHRSLEAQGIDRVARPHIPFAAFQIEKKGEISEVGERLRQEYGARVEAKARGQAAEPAQVQGRAPTSMQSQMPTPTRGEEQGQTQAQALAGAPAAAPPKSLEDIRREAREAWVRMRAAQNSEMPDVRQAPARAQAANMGRAVEGAHSPGVSDARSTESVSHDELDDDYAS